MERDSTWRHGALNGLHVPSWRRSDAVRDARPSSHNTQCWKFSAPGPSRSCPTSPALSAVDPDDHHLFVSLGCAAEN